MEAADNARVDDLLGEDRRFVEIPEELRHLTERERAQGLALQKKFADQEHGLRQKYADSIIWLLGVQFVIADAASVPGPGWGCGGGGRGGGLTATGRG
jgi:hypothetical protein